MQPGVEAHLLDLGGLACIPESESVGQLPRVPEVFSKGSDGFLQQSLTMLVGLLVRFPFIFHVHENVSHPQVENPRLSEEN